MFIGLLTCTTSDNQNSISIFISRKSHKLQKCLWCTFIGFATESAYAINMPGIVSRQWDQLGTLYLCAVSGAAWLHADCLLGTTPAPYSPPHTVTGRGCSRRQLFQAKSHLGTGVFFSFNDCEMLKQLRGYP